MRMYMPLLGGNMVVLCSPADDWGSSLLAACTSKASEGVQVGHLEGDNSHEGPLLHSVGSASCWAVTPCVKRSAGLQAVGQYWQSDIVALISDTLCSIKSFSFFLLLASRALFGCQTSSTC